jgi:hypothetical protein
MPNSIALISCELVLLTCFEGQHIQRHLVNLPVWLPQSQIARAEERIEIVNQPKLIQPVLVHRARFIVYRSQHILFRCPQLAKDSHSTVHQHL